MISQIGDTLILGALATALAGVIVGFSAGSTGSQAGLLWTRRLGYAFSACIIAATLVMVGALVGHDFSVKYVSKVGSLATPLHITIVSLWSSLEGSILFWGMVLGLYTAGFLWATRRMVEPIAPWATATILVTGAFFCFLLAGPANPFSPSPVPVPADGPGPNPLLQNHILMIIHPPALYLGYVGMTLPFGVAVGALLRGQLGPAWQRILRISLLIPWAFLTAGIVLGGWWAYEVLGWGGYWSWDPVENASFMPWLSSTAALHALMLPGRRGTMKGWTVTLVLATFLLTQLGTFMTRSGVFNSVHSFSQSDIGPTFLIFIAVGLVGSVFLLATRLDRMESEGSPTAPVSRESAFLVNNLIFVALTFTVLIGTTFPLINEAVREVKLSVGEPYFNRMAVPMGLALLFLMGVGPALPWGETSLDRTMREIGPMLLVGVGCAGVAFGLGMDKAGPLATVCGAGFATAVALREIFRPVRVRMREQGEALGVAIGRAFARGRRRIGGHTVHLGMIVMILAIAVSASYRVDREVVLSKGQPIEWRGYSVTFTGAELVREPHRLRREAHFEVVKDGERFTLSPALNTYEMSPTPIGSPDVHTTLTTDFYLSLMNLAEDGGTAGLHMYHNPMIVWLWLGSGIALLGCALAAWPSRRSAAEPAVMAQAAK